MKIKLFDKNVKIPSKAHSTDCGLDLYIPEGFTIHPMETVCLSLKVGFCVPEGCAGIFVPRSSIAKKGLVINPAIVDCEYSGETHLILTNASNNTYTFEKDDRICSFVCFNVINPIIEIVDELPSSDRGTKGLGSTGR